MEELYHFELNIESITVNLLKFIELTNEQS